MDKPATIMTLPEIERELIRLDHKWVELRQAMDECGGAAGSPGEWIFERQGELESEMRRRGVKPTAVAIPTPDGGQRG